MTKQQIYETIVSLTAEIKTTEVGLKLFKAAKLDGQEVKEVSETFINEYPELYGKMCSFATEHNKLIAENETGIDTVIFGLEKDEKNGIFVFNPDVINAASYFALVFLTGIDDSYFFTGEYMEVDYGEENATVFDDSAYFDALEEESGSSYFVRFLGNGFFNEEELEWLKESGFEYSNTYDLLADVFAGKLQEYVG